MQDHQSYESLRATHRQIDAERAADRDRLAAVLSGEAADRTSAPDKEFQTELDRLEAARAQLADHLVQQRQAGKISGYELVYQLQRFDNVGPEKEYEPIGGAVSSGRGSVATARGDMVSQQREAGERHQTAQTDRPGDAGQYREAGPAEPKTHSREDPREALSRRLDGDVQPNPPSRPPEVEQAPGLEL